jgi:Cdc6-like AAA superfamily ATPase
MKSTAKVNKEAIKIKLVQYCERYESQNKAANSLKGVSPATISQIINDNWDLIKTEMWLNVGAQIGYSSKEWIAVETRNYKFLTQLLQDAKEEANVFGVTDEAGSGKSFATDSFAEKNKRTYRIECNEFWNRKQFLGELMSTIGRDNSGLNVSEMVNEIVKSLKQQESPVIILDEFDKVSDQVLYFFITLYNQLEDYCGIVLLATDHLQKRIKRGLKLNKKGYKEIYSRIGRKFIEMPGVNSTDVAQICMANGVTAKEDIKDIIEDCEYDLRRVKRKVHAIKKRTN